MDGVVVEVVGGEAEVVVGAQVRITKVDAVQSLAPVAAGTKTKRTAKESTKTRRKRRRRIAVAQPTRIAAAPRAAIRAKEQQPVQQR